MTDNQEELPTQQTTVLDLDKVKSLIPQYNSSKLCEMIVCDRYFGFNKEIGIMCMEELALRRSQGDTFLFEKYIEEALAKLPALTLGVPDLRATLSQLSKRKK
jgi:hypothetical protein